MPAPTPKRSNLPARPPSKLPEPDINVTPLVDVVLVLLIIFMVITPSLAQGETVELPVVSQVDKRPKDLNPIRVLLTSQGRTLLNKRPIANEQLGPELAILAKKDSTRQVVLNTDAQVPYGRVRSTLALLQSTGFKGVSLQVRPRPEPTQ
jgi:biopolymer transport protein TolR